MSKSNSFRIFALACVGVFLATTPSTGTSLTPPSGYYGLAITSGGAEIGDLFYNVNAYPGFEQSYFELLPQYRTLMSDANGQQFRFFQVITYDDQPTTWNGNIITPPGTAQHTGTVVDTPAGGWDYMLPGGDDSSPFYESDTAINPSTGVAYADWFFAYTAYNNLSTVVHTPDTSARGWVQSNDFPQLDMGSAFLGNKTLIETYITYIDPTLRGNHSFDVLGGFSWGIYNNGGTYANGYTPTGIPLSGINFAELQGALNRSGFNGWSIANCPVPESSTAATMLIGIALIGLRLYRPRSSARLATLQSAAVASSTPREAASSSRFSKG